MNPLARQLADLKVALQQLECAVQQPREEPTCGERILFCFPAVIARLVQVLSEALLHAEYQPTSVFDVIGKAHDRGWLTGELAQWTALIEEYEHLSETDPDDARGTALVEQVRGCSSMLWQTYDRLTQRFRWQVNPLNLSQRRVGPSAKVYRSPVM